MLIPKDCYKSTVYEMVVENSCLRQISQGKGKELERINTDKSFQEFLCKGRRKTAARLKRMGNLKISFLVNGIISGAFMIFRCLYADGNGDFIER